MRYAPPRARRIIRRRSAVSRVKSCGFFSSLRVLVAKIVLTNSLDNEDTTRISHQPAISHQPSAISHNVEAPMETPSTFYVKPTSTPEREAFNGRLGQKNAAPLWNVLGAIVPREPQTPCLPALWRYDELRPLLMEAGGLITAEEAERRVLILENPGLRGASRITQSLYAGLQLHPAGEVARTHRHTAAALRLVIEGPGRLHGRRWRAHDDAPRRLHPDAILDVPQSRQPWRAAGRLAGRPRYSNRQHVRLGLRRTSPPTRCSRYPRTRAIPRAVSDPIYSRSSTPRTQVVSPLRPSVPREAARRSTGCTETARSTLRTVSKCSS